MTNNHYDRIPGIENIFPGQIKVYDLSSMKNCVSGDSPSLLHKHFRTPLSESAMETLVWEIAGLLNCQEHNAVYSYFYRAGDEELPGTEWFLSSARLNKCDKGIPKEVVIFTYDLQLIGDIKKRLYRVLENDGFFKENFMKVSSLTKREKEIVQLLASGMSSHDIATAMYISIHTVTAHRKSINEKLAIQSIAGLLKFAEVFDLTANQPII